MNQLWLITMIMVLSIVWGGFLVSLVIAVRKEGKKNKSV